MSGIVFETERLILRAFDETDLEDLYALLSDPEIMRYCGGVLDKNGALTWLQSARRWHQQLGYDYWAAIEKAGGAFVGQIGILAEELEGESHPCLAYMISRAHQGRGFAREGAKGCVDYWFHTLKQPRLFATVEQQNYISQVVLEKTGMKYLKDVAYLNQTVKFYGIDNPAHE